MSAFPFAVSAEAAAIISASVKAAMSDPRLQGLVAVLTVGEDYQILDISGRIIERYSGTFFDIGFDDPGELSGEGLIEMNINDTRILLSELEVEALSGRELCVQTVEVGWPTSATRKVQLLRARDKDATE
jgi:hypothetical protein